jgi:ribosomal protein S27AE
LTGVAGLLAPRSGEGPAGSTGIAERSEPADWTSNAAPAVLAPPRRRQLIDRYTCPQCEHVLRVSGLGRHRVYFELDDGGAAELVMNRVCPECGHALPGKNPPSARS